MPASGAPRAVHYRLDIADARAHLFHVTLTVPAPAGQQLLQLPVWVPGSYLLREFARHLGPLEATQRGRPVSLVQRDKSSWVAHTDGRAPLQLRYTVYAFDPSVRGAYVDDERGFFNGSALFVAAEGHTERPHRLQLGPLPAGWDVATAMRPAGRRTFEAAGYAELIDHPFELGRFWRAPFEAGGVPHEIVVSGAWPGFDGARLVADVSRLCAAQIRFWHGRGAPPFERYLFLLNARDDGYGGLEHRASTALAASRRELPRAGTDAGDAGYLRLLGLFSHEYFHAWNVKRLRPHELDTPDLGREAHTRLLWFFEGLTSYYDDLLLCRAGLLDAAHYLGLLASHLDGVAAAPGRHAQSVAQASFDAWTRHYRPDENTANATVSYYTKGALVALCLDLTLRQAGASLDDVLRALWRRHAQPLAEADIAAALAAAAGRSLQPELDAWVHGTAELPVAALLARTGVTVAVDAPDLAAALGLRLNEGPLSGVHVKSVLRGSAAERAGLCAGDELLAADGWRLRRLDDARAWLVPGAPFDLLLVRDQRVRHCRVEPGADLARPSHRLRLDPQADAAAVERRRAWIGG